MQVQFAQDAQRFRYVGKNPNGPRIAGVIDAANEAEARKELERYYQELIELKPVGGAKDMGGGNFEEITAQGGRHLGSKLPPNEEREEYNRLRDTPKGGRLPPSNLNKAHDIHHQDVVKGTNLSGFQPGEKVHLGLGTKGGAGFNGTITNIDGGIVEIKNEQGKTYKGSVSNLTKGGIGDAQFFPGGLKVRKPPPPPPPKKGHDDNESEARAYNQGRAAVKAGKKRGDNPHPKGSIEHGRWEAGAISALGKDAKVGDPVVYRGKRARIKTTDVGPNKDVIIEHDDGTTERVPSERIGKDAPKDPKEKDWRKLGPQDYRPDPRSKPLPKVGPQDYRNGEDDRAEEADLVEYKGNPPPKLIEPKRKAPITPGMQRDPIRERSELGVKHSSNDKAMDMQPFRFACDAQPCSGQIVNRLHGFLIIEGMGVDSGSWFMRNASVTRRFPSQQEVEDYVTELAQDAISEKPSKEGREAHSAFSELAQKRKEQEKDYGEAKELREWGGDVDEWSDEARKKAAAARKAMGSKGSSMKKMGYSTPGPQRALLRSGIKKRAPGAAPTDEKG